MDHGLTTEPVFIGATRPAMKFGVTYIGLLFNAMIVMIVFIITKNLLWLLLFIPIHAICYMACQHDPRFFDIGLLWLRTRGPGWLGNLRYYKANAYSALPTNLPNIKGKRRAR